MCYIYNNSRKKNIPSVLPVWDVVPVSPGVVKGGNGPPGVEDGYPVEVDPLG